MLYWCWTTFISPNTWGIACPFLCTCFLLPEIHFSFPHFCLRNVTLSLSPSWMPLSLRTISWPLCLQLCTFLPCCLLLWPYFSGRSFPTILGLRASLFICILNCLLEARDRVLGTYHQHLPQSMTCNRYRINTWNGVGVEGWTAALPLEKSLRDTCKCMGWERPWLYRGREL